MDAVFVKQTFLKASSLSIMMTYGKKDGGNFYGYGIQKSYMQGADYGIGHKGRDLGYSANAFYFPGKNVMHIFFVNYGTDADSKLKKVFQDFQEELLNLTLQ